MLEEVAAYETRDANPIAPPTPSPWARVPPFERTDDMDVLREQAEQLRRLVDNIDNVHDAYIAKHREGELPPGCGAYVAEFPQVIQRYRHLEELRRQQYAAASTFSRTKLRKVYRDVYQGKRHLHNANLPEPLVVKADSDTFTRAAIAQLITEDLQVSGDELMHLLAAAT